VLQQRICSALDLFWVDRHVVWALSQVARFFSGDALDFLAAGGTFRRLLVVPPATHLASAEGQTIDSTISTYDGMYMTWP
jgi:hypothetical protein